MDDVSPEQCMPAQAMSLPAHRDDLQAQCAIGHESGLQPRRRRTEWPPILDRSDIMNPGPALLTPADDGNAGRHAGSLELSSGRSRARRAAGHRPSRYSPIWPGLPGQNVPGNDLVRPLVVSVTVTSVNSTLIGGLQSGWKVAVTESVKSALPFCTGKSPSAETACLFTAFG